MNADIGTFGGFSSKNSSNASSNSRHLSQFGRTVTNEGGLATYGSRAIHTTTLYMPERPSWVPRGRT